MTNQSEHLSDQSDHGKNTDIESPQVPKSENEKTITAPPRSIGGAHRRPGHKTTSEDVSSTTKKKLRVKKKIKNPSKLDFEYVMKYFSLFLLIAQMVGLVLMLRISRKSQQGSELYLASTAVFLMEVMKFIICLSVIYTQCKYNISKFTSEISLHTYDAPYELLKLSIPSFLYCVQNNLLYLALTNLDAATYQVCYQLKILTTAMFSAIMLKRQFSNFKWLSLLVLTIGVAIVQSSGTRPDSSSTADANKNRFIGFIAVLCAACTSGFSGVYFEKILKSSTKTSLWIRNIQMGLPSIIIAYITVYLQDYATIRTKGFFVGYTTLVWCVIIIQAVGGLIVAVVVKYADNVLKGFATSFSIIISVFVNALFFKDDSFHPNLKFFFGTALVLVSSYMYSYPDKKRKGVVGGRKIRESSSSPLPVSSACLNSGNSKSALAHSSSVVL